MAEQMPDFKEQKQLLTQAMAVLPILWEEVSLVGSAAVVSVAKEINGIIAIFRLGVHLPNGKAMIGDAQKRYQEVLRPQFLGAARTELGLPPIDGASAPPKQTAGGT
jgi:hypothetical protein